MNNDLMRALAWRVKAVPSGRKMVLVALADSSDRDGLCWLSLAEVARMVSMDESDAYDHLRSLGRDGFVETALAPALCRVVRDRLRGAAGEQ